jgi:hypothetical protein
MIHRLKIVLLLISTFLLAQCRTIAIQSESERRIVRFKEPMAPAEMLGVNYINLNIKMPGEYIKAFHAAYAAFAVDDNIPIEKRRAENYRIEFHQDHKSYKVDFIAKRTPSELGQLDGGSCVLGRDVTYVVDKETYLLLYKAYYK